MRMRATTRPVGNGYKISKITTYLESKTPSFLLTIQLFQVTVTIKAHMLWSTATIKRFQAGKKLRIFLKST